ncbi:HAD hydrolase-like protein [archaeon]|nr:HAD hydrolase-like protein [archaeon]
MSINVNKKIECILFDFDGVIAETDTGRIQLLSQVLDSKEIDSTKMRSQDIIGLSTATFLRKTYPKLSENIIIEIISIRQQLFIKDLSRYCKPYPHAQETVKHLSTKFDLQLATTNSYSNSISMLNFLGLTECFSQIYSREVIENEHGIKDYNLIVNKIGHEIENTIVIEDSEVGIKSSKNAGFFCIGFNHYNSESIKNNADLVVTSFEQIQKYIYGV